ncbi:peptide ABC transporter substrate-binding protein, partial [Bacillus cereus]|nr:peptide ABC transporter substrate-binding protein [Bacillus cereus]
MLEGDLPSPLAGAAGCRFASRCPFATDRCRQQEPEWKEISPGHFAACHLYEEK